MKSAEDWANIFPVAEEETAMYEQEKIKMIRAIQIDAWRHGMEDAARACKDYSDVLIINGILNRKESTQ